MNSAFVDLSSSVGVTLHTSDGASVIPTQSFGVSRRKELAAASQLLHRGASATSDDVRLIVKYLDEAGYEHRNKENDTGRTQRAAPNMALLKWSGERWEAEGDFSWDQVSQVHSGQGIIHRKWLAPQSHFGVPFISNDPILTVVEGYHSYGDFVIGGGAALEPEKALRKSLAEVTERLIASPKATSAVWLASAIELTSVGLRHVPPFVGPRDSYSEELICDWVPAKDLAGNDVAMLAEKAYFDYIPRSGFRATLLQHTAGLAAGKTIEEAIWAGLSELMERDAYWITMKCRLAVDQLDIRLAALPEQFFDKLHKQGLKLVLCDISLDWPVQIVMALIVDLAGNLPAFSHGVGSGFTYEAAARKAAVEACQVRAGQITHSFDRMAQIVTPSANKAARDTWCDPLAGHFFEHLLSPDSGRRYIVKRDAKSPIEALTELAVSGFHPYWAYLGELGGLHVIRVDMPGVVEPDQMTESLNPRLAGWLRTAGLSYPYAMPIAT